MCCSDPFHQREQDSMSASGGQTIASESQSEDDMDPIVVKYMNRLSDYFFVLGRKIAKDLGHDEVPWIARS